ncbi:MAG TPA: hypothetical protein VEK15_08145 [Vicinamibacteria bacterium]|nr:hypothetical protein [Vicinamibacteria bacterium]
MEPIEYGIVKNMQAALQGIKQTAGYHHTVEALAIKLDPNHKVEDLKPEDGRRPFVLADWSSPDALDSFEKPDRMLRNWPVTVHAIGDVDVESDDARALKHFQLCADVETAVIAAWKAGTLGSTVQNVLLASRELRLNEPEGREVWSIIGWVIQHRRELGVPNG